MGRGSSYDFFNYDEEVIDNWIDKLSTCCIWLELHKEYIRKEWIGKGSYADVYIWERNIDKMQFAIKTINKSKILKS